MRKIPLFLLFFVITLSTAYAQKQFWGTSSLGGLHANGFIFRTDSIGDSLKIVHHFKNAVDGENIGALLYASNNKLYGLASTGGQAAQGVFNGGTFFEYDLDTDQFRVIQHFGPSNTALPGIYLPKGEGLAGLTEVSPGVIYGLMRQGRSVFSYNIATGVFSTPFTLPTYQGGPTNSTLTNWIAETFYKAADGYFYAATYTNSSCPIANPTMGSILRLTLPGNTLAVRHKSSCLVEFGFSYTGYFAEANGKLYSATLSGGVNNKGVIYEYTPATNTYTKKHDFAGSVNNYEPTSLVVAANGKLYGTAHGGGIPEANLPTGGGVLYEFDLTTNTFTKKYDFLLNNSWLGDMGTFPGGLISSANGKLYGVTKFGVFEYNTATSEMRMAGRFWTEAFAPSLLQVCRKPAYQHQPVTTHEICNGAAFSLDLSSANATAVVWKHDNVVDASKTSPELNFTAFTAADAGAWVCTLTNECGSTVAQAINLVADAPDQPAITAEGLLTFCAGETVTLAAPEGFSGYAWSTGETSREIPVSESGDYTVTVSNGCESPVSAATTVTVNVLPPAPTDIEAPSFNTLKAIGASDVYEWTLNDIVLDVQTSEIHVTESGLYKVRSVSTEGCRSADFASLSFAVTDVETGADDAVVIYPNPAKGIVHIKVNSSMRGQTKVSVFNATGRLVLEQSVLFNEESSTLRLENLPAGLYHMMIRKGEKAILKKIVLR
jgi:uncharacterized repeat protein (TIGR03803 family)